MLPSHSPFFSPPSPCFPPGSPLPHPPLLLSVPSFPLCLISHPFLASLLLPLCLLGGGVMIAIWVSSEDRCNGFWSTIPRLPRWTWHSTAMVPEWGVRGGGGGAFGCGYWQALLHQHQHTMTEEPQGPQSELMTREIGYIWGGSAVIVIILIEMKIILLITITEDDFFFIWEPCECLLLLSFLQSAACEHRVCVCVCVTVLSVALLWIQMWSTRKMSYCK